jgi:DNA-binding CsgD family transcriptional regulator
MADARDGFTIRAKRIEAIAPDSNTALQRLIAAATGRFDRADAPRGGAVSLRRALGKTDYAVTAAPLPRRSLLERGPIAFLLITDPQATSARSTSVMSQLFGLSAAEMRLVARLMLGESPEEAAAALNIKVSTARWHLSSLYRKTGTRRQAQLVRLLMSLPNI